MVGFSSESETQLKYLDYVFAGAVSGFITRALFQPLDVLKIRFQLQIEPIQRRSIPSKYRSLTHGIKNIYVEEGIPAFWKGHVPAQWLSITYGAFQFISYEFMTKQAWYFLPECISSRFKPAINFTSGAVAGIIATIGSFPFDVVRTRLVGQGEPKLYKSMLTGMKLMFVQEGPRSLYKGLLPTLIQIAPQTGAQFTFYKLFQEMLGTGSGEKSSAVGNVICGGATGVVAKSLVYPLDTIKKRMQIQGFEEARKPFGSCRSYRGWLHCLFTMFREEKITGFYKGLSPSLYKAAFTTAGYFVFYEETCKLLMIYRKHN